MATVVFDSILALKCWWPTCRTRGSGSFNLRLLQSLFPVSPTSIEFICICWRLINSTTSRLYFPQLQTIIMIARLALALALTVALATSTLTSELKGGYRDTCMVSFLYDHGEMYGKFAATCWTDAGNVHTYKGTTIDLNKCLVNRYGVLDWSPK